MTGRNPIAAIGKILTSAGFVLLALAVAWWYLFFEQVLGENVKKASDCFYYTTDTCSLGSVVGMVGNIPTYSPLVFWAAVAAIVVGLMLIGAAPRKS